MYVADSKYEVAIDRWQQTAANNLLSLLFQLLLHCCHGKHQLGAHVAHQNLFIFPEKMVIIWFVGSFWQGVLYNFAQYFIIWALMSIWQGLTVSWIVIF